MLEYMTLKDVAAALHITVKTLYMMRKRGELKFTKIGAHNRINRAELERFLASHTDGAA